MPRCTMLHTLASWSWQRSKEQLQMLVCIITRGVSSLSFAVCEGCFGSPLWLASVVDKKSVL